MKRDVTCYDGRMDGGRGGKGRRKGLGDGVVAGTAPGVAAEEAADGEPQAAEGAVLADGLDGVLRAGGSEAARRGQPGGNGPLVELNRQQERPHRQGAQGVEQVFA